jgi:hypothetical protein
MYLETEEQGEDDDVENLLMKMQGEDNEEDDLIVGGGCAGLDPKEPMIMHLSHKSAS